MSKTQSRSHAQQQEDLKKGWILFVSRDVVSNVPLEMSTLVS